MSVTPPPGHGTYARYYRPANGLKTAAVTFGFQNGSGALASVAIGAVRTACSAGGALFGTAFISSEWDWVGDYCLVNNGGQLTSSANDVVVPNVGGWNSPPPNVSLVITKRTLLAGRQYRGRLAGIAGLIDETDLDQAGILSGVAALQTAATQILTNLTNAGYPMELIHGAPKGGGITPTPTAVQALEVEAMVGNQRRRLR